MTSILRVLALAPYPETGPSTRFRLAQFQDPLEDLNVALCIRPFLSESEYKERYDHRGLIWKFSVTLCGLRKRFRDLRLTEEYDVAVVHRELAPIGNGLLRAELVRRGVPYIFDFDDAVFLPAPGSDRILGQFRRPRTATASFCKDADLVWAGNEYLAEFARTAARDSATDVDVLPTVIDAHRFRPRPDAREGESAATDVPSSARDERGFTGEKSDESLPVVGWIGTHSTVPNLEELFPPLRKVAERTDFKLLVVSNRPPSRVPDDIRFEFRPWSAQREVEDTRALDVGLYPLDDTPWNRGKCGFKAIQYLSCGVPVVASPVGVIRSIVIPGETGEWARSEDEWIEQLSGLLSHGERRARMGRRGRLHVEENYSVQSVVGSMADAMRRVVRVGSGEGG